jgi:dienelactone hydrolase
MKTATATSRLMICLALLAGCTAPSGAPSGATSGGLFAGQGPGELLAIPVQPVADARPSPRPLPGRLVLPDGPGPFPVVILLHGCGGIGKGASLNAWASRLNGWGYGALILNSFAPRNVATVCAPALQHLVTAEDRAGDTIDAALFLRTLPQVDPDRIGVIGFSHGGGTAAAVTAKAFTDAHPGLLKAVVDYYGACRRPDLHGTVPLLALAGDDDDWGHPARSCKNFALAMRPDQPFEVFTYPDTVHAFDNAALVIRTSNEGHPMQYNGAAAADSFARVKAFLARWMPAKT